MMHNHPHPGELLREDVLIPLGIEVSEAARARDVEEFPFACHPWPRRYQSRPGGAFGAGWCQYGAILG